LLVVIALPWLVISIAFSSGAIKCPSCSAPMAARFGIRVPRKCLNCGYDVNAPNQRRDF
jgi:transposase-like protein